MLGGKASLRSAAINGQVSGTLFGRNRRCRANVRLERFLLTPGAKSLIFEKQYLLPHRGGTGTRGVGFTRNAGLLLYFAARSGYYVAGRDGIHRKKRVHVAAVTLK
jgi:hypothetical protein